MRFLSLFLSLLALPFAVAAPLANETTTDGDVEAHGCNNTLTAEEASEIEARIESELARADLPDFLSDSSRTAPIRVEWHIIAPSATAPGALSNGQVLASISALNTYYSSIGIQFYLGNITRTWNPSWFFLASQGNPLDTSMKNLLHRGTRRTLNVYSVNLGGNPERGYATWPWNVAANLNRDGVVIRYRTVPGGGEPNYSQGKTLVHHVGHWLGLYHVFQGNSCGGPGDYVLDTPPQLTASFGCPNFKNTCPGGGPDSIRNFMDMTYDWCKYLFTYRQGVRARQLAWIYRGL
ncbi:Extracellular metalloprotease 1; Flags: Precursor [Serendipita indica DSM 11827]|uniref:Related to metalloprotease MEP1 n=1 Tax=Serendipita indica (strain DSM 11827) TaxID=1109443 RepID=G4T9S2_SERID|nr:Extracellular metalloprotease 1; Flags: Precursor [Serendipita indica DSM 11827]CCA68065.1 related to metalloprotease MEP1 [Serendipita indica DSM 11827]